MGRILTFSLTSLNRGSRIGRNQGLYARGVATSGTRSSTTESQLNNINNSIKDMKSLQRKLGATLILLGVTNLVLGVTNLIRSYEGKRFD